MRSMSVRDWSAESGAHRHRLERQLQARERRLELMRDEREEAVLFLQHPRFGAQAHAR